MGEEKHVMGPDDAPITLLEFGDFGCPHCAAARIPIESLIERLGRVRLVWRHYFNIELHPGADLAAEASEAAHAQDAFWPMHRRLLDHQGAFDRAGLRGIASDLALDLTRFDEEMDQRSWREVVARDAEDAKRRGLTGTPTFFVNDERVIGSWTQLRTLLPGAVEDLPQRG